MLALNSVIAAMLADRQSISSSIFLKSFFIFLIVSGKKKNGQTGEYFKMRTISTKHTLSETLAHL